MSLPSRIIVTSALEHLAEKEIDCLEAAAFYALSVHDKWQEAGLRWLNPVADTWFKDWVAERPTYRKFAKLSKESGEKLPPWIAA